MNNKWLLKELTEESKFIQERIPHMSLDQKERLLRTLRESKQKLVRLARLDTMNL
jgi:hypothetical protein